MSSKGRGAAEAVSRHVRGALRGGTAARVAVVMAAVACLVGQTLGVSGATPALAQGEQASYYNDHGGDVGPYEASSFGCYQRTDDGSDSGVAYCMDGEKHGPNAEVTYTSEGGSDTVLSYLVAYGYPNGTTICGRTLSAGEARSVTQIAIWYHRGYDLTAQGLSGERLDLAQLGIRFCREAEAYEASGGANLGCGTVWYANDSSQRMLLTSEAKGGVELTKSSANHEVTDANGSYSLAGAVYTVYSDAACTKAVATITTDAAGRGSASGLVQGSYWAKETTPASNYALSGDVIAFKVAGGQVTQVAAEDAPQVNDLVTVLAKLDAETGRASALGAGTLGGATFEVGYYDGQYDAESLPARATRTWTVTTEADGTADLSSAKGDALYHDTAGRACVPVGTVTVRETAAPEGYLAAGGTQVAHVTSSGTAELVSAYVAPKVPEQVKRGDLSLVKVREGSMARLAGVPFLITSKTTGEAHVIVTDANGEANTSSSWNAHTAGTNSNDVATTGGTTSATAGVWFSGSTSQATAADDSKGALPYDTYSVTELRCEANEGLDLVSFDVTVTRDATCVNGGTVDDQEGPAIATTLTGEGGEHMAQADATATLTDTVEYENLMAGREYELTGTLMDRSTGKAVTDADGGAVTATTTFTPRLSTGTTTVTFELDTSGLAGRSVVAFESLALDGKVVATHADIDDDWQTVDIPKVGTTATDAEDGAHDACADGDVTLEDVVAYENLVPGKEYQLTGTLMDKGTGEAVTGPDGEPVTSTTTFTPEASSGSETVTFRFDPSLMAGRTVVAFEELMHEGRTYAVHADIDDEGQSVTFPKVSTTATDASDGDKLLDATEGGEVVDVVSYEGVTPGEAYVVSGTLVDSGTGDVLSTGTTELVPDGESGTCEVRFEVDATGMEGRSLVCTEELSRGGKAVATHADLSDEGQTVCVPAIGTTATDAADGDHEAEASAEVTIVDTVEYSGLVPGREYEVTGTLVDKGSGDAVTGPDGGKVTSSATFTPEATEGTVDVTFTFDGTSLAGHDVVAFETVTHEGRVVATHADLSDEGQTVGIVEAPVVPTEGLPKTGDEGLPLVPAAALAPCAVGAVAGSWALRRHVARDRGGEGDE